MDEASPEHTLEAMLGAIFWSLKYMELEIESVRGESSLEKRNDRLQKIDERMKKILETFPYPDREKELVSFAIHQLVKEHGLR